MEPICDNHKPLYNVPIRFVGPVEVRGEMTSGGFPTMRADLKNAWACVDESCSRYFDDSLGYFSVPGGNARAYSECYCNIDRYTVMCIASVSEDRKHVTLGCLRCSRTVESDAP